MFPNTNIANVTPLAGLAVISHAVCTLRLITSRLAFTGAPILEVCQRLLVCHYAPPSSDAVRRPPPSSYIVTVRKRRPDILKVCAITERICGVRITYKSRSLVSRDHPSHPCRITHWPMQDQNNQGTTLSPILVKPLTTGDRTTQQTSSAVTKALEGGPNLDIEHVLVKDDPRGWSDARKV